VVEEKTLAVPGVQDHEEDGAVDILQLSVEIRQAVPVFRRYTDRKQLDEIFQHWFLT
jgi:hypothetical protein